MTVNRLEVLEERAKKHPLYQKRLRLHIEDARQDLERMPWQADRIIRDLARTIDLYEKDGDEDEDY